MQKYHIPQTLVPPIYYRFIKRGFDIVFSLLICIFVLPILYVILGSIIKLTSHGPIIFQQKRFGMFGKVFMCYKFRSMYQDAGPEKVMSKDDNRITPIGRFIRCTHIDEFPQFFNVLKGDMSIVGPRPLPPREIKKFNCAPEGYIRLILRPGITGLTQVNSGRLLSCEQWLQYDKLYVSKHSLINDVLLIFKTLKFSDNTY